ncbi:RNA degradosome polyphosphate kinase [Jeotgalibacillus sp. S-D1]|uniref:RNA degradosome polyphosphate kinase n=1 Tax=Jeotgalibacillus sp. S-D1 TaxID=2552189 RepID=UPI0010596144|nr:RNA degradosome polyphosphate kinase [Jeotgalibacillus sp. S-D1]TDL35213.1 RNA degradosome polyphosphate kinase [Jeotgalibacillus sp. S-D1]
MDPKIENLDKPEHFNNRELSWLGFNERVLMEAVDHTNPLLEQLKYLAIFSSNLDEFFMVRVAGLKDQVKVNFRRPENKAGLTPKEQLNEISLYSHRLVRFQNKTFVKDLLPKLKKENIIFYGMDQLTKEQMDYIETFFDEQVFPVLTPMAVDAYRPFPMLLNKSINLIVCLEKQKSEERIENVAIVQVPSVLKRAIQIPASNEKAFILLEEVIKFFINKLFIGYQVSSIGTFRITRNADLTIHEEGARDLLVQIEKELKKRKWGAAVRLEVHKGTMDKNILHYLMEELEVEEDDVYENEGPIDLTYLFDFVKQAKKQNEHLLFPSFIPQPPEDLASNENLFERSLSRDLMFHHPFESFNPIVDLVNDAADDPQVLAIKQTLYRVSGDSPVIEALKRAAENGKQVTVLVELKARFDEENNVQWAKELEKAGCHVIYGMNFLKTHSKITLVVRQKNGVVERFVHLGTGNYNDQTAKLYTDIGIITTNQKYGTDATNFFNYLSGYTETPAYHHLVVAPFSIRDKISKLIDQEIEYQKLHGNGHIIAKMNSLTDKKLILKLYEASSYGVKIDLIVRGICCLRPGLPGVSENIRVISIVGRFLEHSRIYYFHHNGKNSTYLSSADLMTRNMEKRVELLFPIFDRKHKKRMRAILDLYLQDNVKARYQTSDGHYIYVERQENQAFNAQQELLVKAYRIQEEQE